ncbi:SH2 domain-containing adapter protein D-like isoform X1 [Carcharodon carcharias]|uniref:SH2 domain-containing adapter protein D-like isoform X1 n=1 Tax=Carcharodon carcharias TaxID=13397 RepID=UPI001B7E3E58|nr:SH2 domain-containing adapter protein D-like isoform X1 [Carcharodon carcharias]
MAKWFKEHLGFRSSKGPPQPPKPDYRARPAGEPDILAAYKLQKERDFEDPYTGGGGGGGGGSRCLQRLRSEGEAAGGAPAPAPGGTGTGSGSSPHPHPAKKAASPDVKYISPKHRLIKVENPERSCSKSPTSPDDSKQGKVIILEDYADPFDAKQAGVAQVGQEKVTENDGYMEPYEAQKMMAEIRRRGSKEAPGKQLPLYDTPYEPTENGGESDMEKAVSHRPRESRLPEDDERPPGEYDQPWEWKKDRISKAFAVEIKVIKELPWPPPVGQLDSGTPKAEGDLLVSHCHLLHQHHHLHSQPVQPQPVPEDSSVQFDGVDKSRFSPPKEEKVRHQNRLSGPNLKSLKHQSLEFSGPLGERVEPNLSLGRQTWYHGAISRTDAENLLRLCKESSYLVRNSETTKNDYSLSLKSNQGFMHMKLTRTKESKYVLGLNSPPFDSVPEIIHYYSSRKLPIKGAEHMSLLYPVAIRTL